MCALPAHLSRSIGGGFDNESVAISAMTATFALWCRAIRAQTGGGASTPFGIASVAARGAAAGLGYAAMAASWGGYVFAVNVIAVHAAVIYAIHSFRAWLFGARARALAKARSRKEENSVR